MQSPTKESPVGSFADQAAQQQQLKALLQFAGESNAVIVYSTGSPACNLDALRKIARVLTGRGVLIEFVKELLFFCG